MPPTIGFIGLGIMGRPMAANLLKAGYPLVAHNRSRGAVDELARDGAQPAASAAEVAERSEVTITMLPDSPQVAEVMDDVLCAASAGQLVIDMSTIAPAVTRELAARAAAQDIELLDAPVSGGDVGAREATLSIMVGGSASAFDRARPILETLGSTVTHVGESGAGQVVKACNQVVVALVIEAVSEALVLGSKGGVDPETVIRVLSGGLAANRVMEVRGRNFLEHDFTPGFKVDLHHKDLGIALSTAKTSGAVLPLTAAVEQLLSSLRQHGRGGDDHSALLTVIEGLSNHRIGSQRA
ncbi:MAG TPA: 2-hydroxy-3-oxopropionate reductase [Solirubrobacteraceae bacterium]|nr:2-hydroxy-3-oxopropionate reductase [Solirubrobacteraceae bacterium]